MIYTAKLTGNRRDVGTTSPKILLINIDPNDHLNRDHCWVTITPYLEKIAPKGHQKPKRIKFEADTKPYLKQGKEECVTLTNIRNIAKR